MKLRKPFTDSNFVRDWDDVYRAVRRDRKKMEVLEDITRYYENRFKKKGFTYNKFTNGELIYFKETHKNPLNRY